MRSFSSNITTDIKILRGTQKHQLSSVANFISNATKKRFKRFVATHHRNQIKTKAKLGWFVTYPRDGYPKFVLVFTQFFLIVLCFFA